MLLLLAVRGELSPWLTYVNQVVGEEGTPDPKKPRTQTDLVPNQFAPPKLL